VCTNNLRGDNDFPPGDDMPTGVTVATATSPISITIVHNLIEFDHYGIWTTGPVTITASPPGNTFVGVTTPTVP
jgi:hypothetical protein